MRCAFPNSGAASLYRWSPRRTVKRVCDEIHRAGGSSGYATATFAILPPSKRAAAAQINNSAAAHTIVNNAAGNFMRARNVSPNAFNAVVWHRAKRFVSLHANFRKALDRAKRAAMF